MYIVDEIILEVEIHIYIHICIFYILYLYRWNNALYVWHKSFQNDNSQMIKYTFFLIQLFLLPSQIQSYSWLCTSHAASFTNAHFPPLLSLVSFPPSILSWLRGSFLLIFFSCSVLYTQLLNTVVRSIVRASCLTWQHDTHVILVKMDHFQLSLS